MADTTPLSKQQTKKGGGPGTEATPTTAICIKYTDSVVKIE